MHSTFITMNPNIVLISHSIVHCNDVVYNDSWIRNNAIHFIVCMLKLMKYQTVDIVRIRLFIHDRWSVTAIPIHYIQYCSCIVTMPSGLGLGRLHPSLLVLNGGPSPPVLITDPDPWVQGLPRVTQTMARGALQLEIYPKYHVSGAPWAGRHGISVITLVPGRFSPPNVVWVQATNEFVLATELHFLATTGTY